MSSTATLQREIVVEDPSPSLRRTADTSSAAAVGSTKRPSLLLPIGLFPNQSRPTTTTSRTTVATTSRAILSTTTTTTTPARSESIITGTNTAAAAAAATIAGEGNSTARRNSNKSSSTKKVKISLGLSSVVSPRKIQNKIRRSFSTKNKIMKPPQLPLLLEGGEANTTTANHHAENVVQWLEICCPNDVVPKVLAFCGPHTTAALMSTNRYWFRLIAKTDSTWRTLCEGMYKWTEGQDEVPESWKDYYRTHPCVPVDYPSIPRALMAASAPCSKSSNGSGFMRSSTNSNSNKKNKDQQGHSIDILLRPGKHIVKESLVVQATEEDVKVTLRTCTMPQNRHYSPRFAYAEQEHPQSFPIPHNKNKSKNRNSTKLKQFLGCKSAASVTGAVVGGGAAFADSMDPPNLFAAAGNNNFYYDDHSNNAAGMEDISESSNYQSQRSRARSLSAADAARINVLSSLMPPPRYQTRATIVLRTRRNNEPVIRVKQGDLVLQGVDLEHASQGVDIWNGNAAIQIQPPLGPDNEPMVTATPKPTATIENVAITSKSGRGVVCLDGGQVNLNDCMIYDCAATGLYIGGPGSQAEMTHTDVIRNGIGSRLPPNPRLPRVTSGHSGVYLEQGLAKISECNISSNYLTGISAVSFEKAFLNLSKTDLVANGQGNLELPPPGTVSYDKSEIAKDNNLASVGRPCLRSNLELPARARARASF